MTIDGNGHTLDGIKGSNTIGISFAPQENRLSNVVVKNIVMQDWNTAVEFTRCNGGTIENLKASRNALLAIRIYDSSYITVKNCELNENNNGIYVEYST